MKRNRKFRPRGGIKFSNTPRSGPPQGFVKGRESLNVAAPAGTILPSVTGTSGITAVSSEPLDEILLGSQIPQKASYREVVTQKPSWTNSHIDGRNDGFVISMLSANRHEVTTLGYIASGSTDGFDDYYSANEKYYTVTVKKTASIVDCAFPQGGNKEFIPTDRWIPVHFVEGKGLDVSWVTGSYFPPATGPIPTKTRSNVAFPATIPIDVPHSGKIVDLKVWVEFVNVSGSGITAGKYPLGNVFLGLRSPNVTFGHAHPIRNDSDLKRIFTSNLTDFSYDSLGIVTRALFGPDFICDGYRDTFILWESPSLFESNLSSFGPYDNDTLYVTKKYPTFQRDRSMRTVFCDGASIPNPRHLSDAQYNGAPNAFFGMNSPIGNDVPWTSEEEISGSQAYKADGSPPAGWLTGPGGTNAENEWPTTGVNYGATHIRPLYPLLDPVFQRKRFPEEENLVMISATGSEASFSPDLWRGFRPGLRGTEASGTWHLLIAGGHYSVAGIPESPMYLRQFRLEFTLERNARPHYRRDRRSLIPRQAEDHFLLSISGSDRYEVQFGGAQVTASWDTGISDTYIPGNSLSEVRSTFGVTLNTGSFVEDGFALLYRLTGSLADIVGNAPDWLVDPSMGIPTLPESSASLVHTAIEPIEPLNVRGVLFPSKILDSAKNIRTVSKTVNPPKKLSQMALEFASGSNT